MTSPTITLENLSNIIDQCISDLRKGDGNKLYDLAGVFNSIAECNSESYLFVFPQGVGAFTNELLGAKSLTLIPVLSEETRTAHQTVIDSAIEKTTTALEEIKTQFCSESTDYEKLKVYRSIFSTGRYSEVATKAVC